MLRFIIPILPEELSYVLDQQITGRKWDLHSHSPQQLCAGTVTNTTLHIKQAYTHCTTHTHNAHRLSICIQTQLHTNSTTYTCIPHTYVYTAQQHITSQHMHRNTHTHTHTLHNHEGLKIPFHLPCFYI